MQKLASDMNIKAWLYIYADAAAAVAIVERHKSHSHMKEIIMLSTTCFCIYIDKFDLRFYHEL